MTLSQIRKIYNIVYPILCSGESPAEQVDRIIGKLSKPADPFAKLVLPRKNVMRPAMIETVVSHEFSSTDIIATILAGNMIRFTCGLTVPPFSGFKDQEESRGRVVGVELVTTPVKHIPGVLATFFLLEGMAAGHTTKAFFTSNMLQWRLGPILKLRHKREGRDIVTTVYPWDLMDTMLLLVFERGTSLQPKEYKTGKSDIDNHNLKLFKSRNPTTRKCPLDIEEEKCMLCTVGKTKCQAATQVNPLVKIQCSTCNKEAYGIAGSQACRGCEIRWWETSV